MKQLSFLHDVLIFVFLNVIELLVEINPDGNHPY